MGYVTLFFQFIVALPKLWAILKEVAQWIHTTKQNKKFRNREEAKREMTEGKTKKERENAADKFLDND